MLDQNVAKVLFCGICISPNFTHAEYLQESFFDYSDNNSYDSRGLPLRDMEYYRTPEEFSGYMSPKPEEVKLPEKIQLGLQATIDYLVNHNLDRVVATNSINVSNGELANTADALLNWQGAYTPEEMRSNFHLINLTQGNNSKSKFTGYYTPTILARLSANSEYHYPIYKSPLSEKRLLSRKQISSGGLENQGLEVAWTNDPVGLFYMQIQGSGELQFPNGEKKSLIFDGSNEKKFISIAKHMQTHTLFKGNPSRKNIKRWLDDHSYAMDEVLNVNPRYIYFKLHDSDIKTASGIPVVPGHTVAIDTDYIPFGSVILAEVPVTNDLGKVIRNEWRILFSQDRGNAIKGPARIDIYTGAGEAARKLANNITGFRQAYLLLNKSQYEQEVTAIDNEEENLN